MKHPLYVKGLDTASSYKTKLFEAADKCSSLAEVKTDLPGFSTLATNLFSKLTNFVSSKRYTASEALAHPWLTRINGTLIPLTLPEKFS